MNSSIFLSFFELSKNKLIADFAIFLSYPFSYGTLILLIIWAVLFSNRKIYTFSVLFLSGTSSWIIANILKLIFHTARPFTELGIIPLYMEKTFSFPSSHVTVFASVAIVLFSLNKK